MKQKEIGLLLGLFLLPTLVQAIPFKNFKLIQTVSSPFYAGDTQSFIVSFDAPTNKNLTVNVNIEELTEYPVLEDDLSLKVELNNHSLDCIEYEDGGFFCEGLVNYKNTLRANITPKQNLYPSLYNFTLSLYMDVGFKAEGTGCVWEEVERCLWKRCWTRRTRVCKPAILFTDEDKLKLEMKDKTIEWDIERYQYRRWFESYYGVSDDWKRFNAHVLWNGFVYGHGAEVYFSGRVI